MAWTGCAVNREVNVLATNEANWPGSQQQQVDIEMPVELLGQQQEPIPAAPSATEPTVQLATLQQQIDNLRQQLARSTAQRKPRIERLVASPISRSSVSKRVLPAGHEQELTLVGPEEVEGLLLPNPTVDQASGRVSDTFIETDVRQAIQLLATQAGVMTLVDEGVRGSVTATIDNQPFDMALRQILTPLGYVFKQVEGTYYIGSAEPNSSLFHWLAEQYRYTALYRAPEELVTLMPERYHRFLQVSPQGGWIIVEAPQEHTERILKALEQLDQPVPQVVLEALICVYSPETNFRFGFDLDAGVRVFDRTTQLAVNSLNLVGNVSDLSSTGDLNSFRNTNAVLRCLEQRGFVKIRAAPRVMAQDGQKAQIHIGRESFFSVQPEMSNLVFRQDIEQVSSGIMLEITPTIRDPYVTIAIDRAEVSEDIRADETQSNSTDRFPVINRRSVSTTVQVEDGKTIVIGGLTQRQKVNVFNKVPLLGSIPLVGKLFRRVERQDQKAEVAIFISPRIVKDSECSECETEIQLVDPHRDRERQ